MLAEILYGRLVTLQVFLDVNVHADFHFPGSEYLYKFLAIVLAICIIVLLCVFAYCFVMICVTFAGKKKEGIASYAVGAGLSIFVLVLLYQGTHFPEKFAHYIQQ